MVSKKEPTLIFDDVDSIDADAIQDFEEKERKHLDMFADSDTYLGGWVDGETGKVYIDVSVNVKSGLDQALKLGEDNDQLAIFDLDSFEVYDVKTGKPYSEKGDTDGERKTNQTPDSQGSGQKGRHQKAHRSRQSSQEGSPARALDDAIWSLKEIDAVTVKSNGTIVVVKD
jgi:hypothetical protein